MVRLGTVNPRTTTLEALVEILADPIVVVDSSGSVTQANASAEALLGWGRPRVRCPRFDQLARGQVHAKDRVQIIHQLPRLRYDESPNRTDATDPFRLHLAPQVTHRGGDHRRRASRVAGEREGP